MTKDVVKELQKTLDKRKAANEKNAVISQVNNLLEYDTQRDLDVLRSVGAQSTLVQSEAERGNIIELEKKQKFYSGTIFTKEQIIKLAVKYRLKLLPSTLFTAYIDPLVAVDIKELERNISQSMENEQAEKRNLSVEDYRAKYGETKYQFDKSILKSNFFILAPAKCFNIKKTSAFTLKSPDPILFYTDDNAHFRLLRKWGSDFTVLRWFKGFAFKSMLNLFLSAFISTLIVALGLSIKFDWHFMFIQLWMPITIIILWVFSYEPETDFFGRNYVTSHKRY